MIPLGTPFSPSKSKKREASAPKAPKFIFVPYNTTKVNTSFAGKEELWMVREAQISKDFKGGALVGKTDLLHQLLLLIVLLEVLFQVPQFMNLIRMVMPLISKKLDIWHCA